MWERCALLDFRHDSFDTMSLRELVFQNYHIPMKKIDLIFGTKIQLYQRMSFLVCMYSTEERTENSLSMLILGGGNSPNSESIEL